MIKQNKYSKKFLRTGLRVIVFLLIFIWIFSGFPSIWQNPPIPPEIQEAQAADISYVGAGTLGAATLTTDATAALPAGTQANDILLIHAWTRNTGDTTVVTGFTEIAQVDTGTGSHRWFWKRHSGSEGTATCDHNTSADNYCQMFAFRNVIATGDPWNALGTAQVDTGTTDPVSFTGITTGAANSMVLIFAGYEDNDMASVIMTSTDPADYTEVYAESATGSDGSISIGYALRTAAGATGNFTIDYSGTARSDDLAVLMLSLAPVPPTGPAVTAPASVTMNSYQLGGAGYNDYTFASGELVAVTNSGSSGWSLTVSSTNMTGTKNTITNANILLRTDGTLATEPTIITSSDSLTGVTETTSGNYSLDSTRTIVSASAGNGIGTYNTRPTIRVNINNYGTYAETDTATLTFTVQ